MFAKDTLEDPASRIERDGFLDEIERISEAMGIFDLARFAALDAFLAAPGPEVVPDPEHLERYDDAAVAAGVAPGQPIDAAAVTGLVGALGVEVTYALLTYARRAPADGLDDVIAGLDAQLPRPDASQPYLPLDLPPLPHITKPRVEPKRLSTGQMALEIARVGDAWRIRCTGCGEASPPVEFRWQVLDQTVACRCA